MDETILTIVFLVITFLSWLFSQIKENKGPKNKKRRPAQKPMDLGNEIENFLQEISGNKPEKKQKQNPKPVVIKKSRPKKKIVKTRRVLESAGTKKSKSFETNISKQHLDKKNYGSKLSQHVSTYMDGDVKEHVQDHLAREVSKSVSSNLGHFSKDISRSAVEKKQTHSVVELFKDRKNVARAIMLNEILSPPLSLRNK